MNVLHSSTVDTPSRINSFDIALGISSGNFPSQYSIVSFPDSLSIFVYMLATSV